MHYGVFIFPTDYSIRIDELARAAEERGFESLFVTEHTHIPTSRRTAFPGGGALPKEYSHTLDPFIGLMAAASVTKNLKVGTGICLVIEHDPITLAKTIASLDLLSNGRFLFGIGAGWNAEEMENHGTEFKTRFRLLRERILAMKEIWTKDEAKYRGEFVNFDPIWSYPKPAQKPHPPIVIGGSAKNVLKRIVDHADGWLPNRVTPASLEQARKELDRLAVAAGRDPKSITISVYGQEPKKEIVRPLFDAGADRVVVRATHVETEAEMGAQLEQMAEAVL